MTSDSRNKSVHAEASEQQDFRKIARQVLEMIGTEFFSMLVKQLAGVLDAECVYMGEFLGRKTDRVRTLAACAGAPGWRRSNSCWPAVRPQKWRGVVRACTRGEFGRHSPMTACYLI